MNRVFLAFTVPFGALLLLTGCSGGSELLGIGKRSPDEFSVYSRAPLTLPPDYNLRPPAAPGAAPPTAALPRGDAKGVIVGRTGPTRPASPWQSEGVSADPGLSFGTQAILARSGAGEADPNIRRVIDEETSILAEEDETFVEALMFWSTPTEYGSVVDPGAEARRIGQNQALGRPLGTGQTPTIERKQKALLEDLF